MGTLNQKERREATKSESALAQGQEVDGNGFRKIQKCNTSLIPPRFFKRNGKPANAKGKGLSNVSEKS